MRNPGVRKYENEKIHMDGWYLKIWGRFFSWKPGDSGVGEKTNINFRFKPLVLQGCNLYRLTHSAPVIPCEEKVFRYLKNLSQTT